MEKQRGGTGGSKEGVHRYFEGARGSSRREGLLRG
jgi:hypothetical protein